MKYLLTLVIFSLATMLISFEVAHNSYLRGHRAGYDMGVESVRKSVDLIIQRPGVKKYGLWKNRGLSKVGR